MKRVDPAHDGGELAPPSDAPFGPKVAEDAECRLRRSAYPPLQTVNCEFREGVLFLRGRLPSYFLKQIAQETVARIEGVQQIANEVEVISPLRRELFNAR
jgi:osmotically-inducible protein OsmY